MMHSVVEITTFRKAEGNCWTSVLPVALKRGDVAGRAPASKLMLFEDETALGPAGSTHDVIREVGRGAFSHWNNELWFSTSDNTSPILNRRRYLVVAERVAAEHSDAPALLEGHGSAPVNYQPVSAAPSSIERDAEYAVATAQSYIDCLPDGVGHLSGRSVLELGPGLNFGAVLVLLCWGAARVAVADRFLVPFSSVYHVPLYRKIRELIVKREPAVILDPLNDVIASEQHSAEGLTAYSTSLEELVQIVDTSFDVTASNAVFEHLFNPRAAIRALHQLTSSGGIGLHQVDFRDHRDFSRPLEFLLDDERSFALLFDKEFGQTGSRIRPFQMEAMFRDAGFSTVSFAVNLLAESDYLDEFIVRLRAAITSPFSTSNIDHLRAVSGRFVVGK